MPPQQMVSQVVMLFHHDHDTVMALSRIAMLPTVPPTVILLNMQQSEECLLIACCA